MSDAKRLTRHEIQEPDQFVSTMDQVLNYVTGHRNRVIGMFAGAIALGVVVAAVLGWLSARNAAASGALKDLLAIEARPVGMTPPAAPGAMPPPQGEPFATQAAKDAALIEASDRLLASHGSSPAARTARMIKAEVLARGAKYGEAATLYGEVAGGNPSDALGGAAALARAAARAGAGEVDPAVEDLTKLAAASNPYVPKDYALESAAEILETAGRKAEAAKLYKRLADEVATSPLADAARTKATQLGAPAGTPGVPAAGAVEK